MKEKQVFRALRELAKTLPKRYYIAYTKPDFKTIKKTDGTGKEIEVKDRNQPIVRGENFEANHYKRMKSIYKRDGMEGVNKYCKEVKEMKDETSEDSVQGTA